MTIKLRIQVSMRITPLNRKLVELHTSTFRKSKPKLINVKRSWMSYPSNRLNMMAKMKLKQNCADKSTMVPCLLFANRLPMLGKCLQAKLNLLLFGYSTNCFQIAKVTKQEHGISSELLNPQTSYGKICTHLLHPDL